MRCLKKVIIGFGIFLPVLLSALFVSPSYAVSDFTYTVNSSNGGQGFYWFCSDNSCSLSDYHYVLLDFSNLGGTPSSYNFNASTILRFVSGTLYHEYSFHPYFQDKVLLSLTGTETGLGLDRQYSGSYPSGWYYTVTLSENNPLTGSCPEPEEPEPCPVVPETPYGDQLNNITLAIYTCGGILLVLYFFYCIYRIIIKNSGVSNL